MLILENMKRKIRKGLKVIEKMKKQTLQKIREKVLEKWFGTNNLDWVDNCPPDELDKEDVIGCIDLAIKLTEKELKKK